MQDYGLACAATAWAAALTAMSQSLNPFRLLAVTLAGWMNQQRRLAAKAEKITRKVLDEAATIVTPET